ncbi:hypothetical protein B9Z55_021229 [Caenorhabditis nigoni]|uniref:F-box domain-containing protein n=2 Tax=Caenorhabditis nigoni TaxID=1611254 RepID=A0A2G5TR68_9PELO|nr:hypothetical protein B9Z55_021229 [Caenorhabditis nigoni]
MFSIIEMPELVMEKIIEFSDFKAVLTLRQVCRDFRNFIDDLNDSKLPDSKFAKIEIVSDKKENEIILDFVNSDNSYYRIEYSETENSRKFQETTKLFQNSNIVDVAIRDLELILKFQKSTLKRLFFSFQHFQLQNDSSVHTLPIKLSNLFHGLGRKIKTRKFIINTSDTSQIMTVLPFASPEALETLKLYALDGVEKKEVEIDEFAKTEQWKKAERMDCGFRVLNLKVEDICHFSRLYIKVPSITARDLDFLRKTYISSSKFKNSVFNLMVFNEIEEITDLWGAAFTTGSSTHSWYFRTKNSKEKILLIEFCPIPQVFFFKTIRPNFVWTGAIVHDYDEH